MSPPKGFTLLEMVLSLSLFLLCLALCLPFLHMQRKVWSDQERYREEFGSITSALNWIVRDLQEAGYRCAGPALREVSGSSITYAISRDEDDPGEFSEGNRRLVAVYLRGRDLMYRIQKWDPVARLWGRGVTQKIASGVSSLRFDALDGRGDPADSADDAAGVRITLCGERSGRLTSYVSLRNGRGRGRP